MVQIFHLLNYQVLTKINQNILFHLINYHIFDINLQQNSQLFYILYEQNQQHLIIH